MNIYGASGHGKVIVDILKSRNEEINFVFDDNKEVTQFLDYKVAHIFTAEMLNHSTVICIGNNSIRKNISRRFKGVFAHPVIHASASVSDTAIIGMGTVVMAKAVINAANSIGEHSIINSGAVIEHDVFLNDFVHISPGAVVTGNVRIGEGTHIGAGAVVIPGVSIGKWVTVGAGAVVINDVPDYAVVVGNPGKIIKYNTD